MKSVQLNIPETRDEALSLVTDPDVKSFFANSEIEYNDSFYSNGKLNIEFTNEEYNVIYVSGEDSFTIICENNCFTVENNNVTFYPNANVLVKALIGSVKSGTLQTEDSIVTPTDRYGNSLDVMDDDNEDEDEDEDSD